MNKPTTKLQPGVPSWLRQQWQTWWATNTKGLVGNDIALAVGICPSYITRIRNGFIPRRDVVESLGQHLGKRDQALLVAGYLPGPAYLPLIAKALKKG